MISIRSTKIFEKKPNKEVTKAQMRMMDASDLYTTAPNLYGAAPGSGFVVSPAQKRHAMSNTHSRARSLTEC